jgi:hypothetical protein
MGFFPNQDPLEPFLEKMTHPVVAVERLAIDAVELAHALGVFFDMRQDARGI